MRKLPSLRKPEPADEPEAESPPESALPPIAWRPRISIKMLMMLTLVVAVAAVGFGGVRREGEGRIFYVLFAIAAPLLVLLVVGVVHQLTRSRR
ncbi:MAG: hypothetical protein AAF589_08740 [Planctomycetota bacterium]